MALIDGKAAGSELPLHYADRLVDLAGRRPPGWQEVEDYHDPVDGEEFGGEWLAAAEPVIVRVGHEKPIDTGFLVVVQERRSEVLEPVGDLKRRLVYGGTVAGVFLLLVLGVVWVGVISVLEGSPRSRMTRLLRRWAGLPTGTSRTGGTPTASLSAVAPGGSDVNAGGKTARVGAAATPLPPSPPPDSDPDSAGHPSDPPGDTPRD
jgi:hypothetical protein